MLTIENEWVGSPSCVTLIANKGNPPSLWALAKIAMGGGMVLTMLLFLPLL